MANGVKFTKAELKAMDDTVIPLLSSGTSWNEVMKVIEADLNLHPSQSWVRQRYSQYKNKNGVKLAIEENKSVELVQINSNTLFIRKNEIEITPELRQLIIKDLQKDIKDRYILAHNSKNLIKKTMYETNEYYDSEVSKKRIKKDDKFRDEVNNYIKSDLPTQHMALDVPMKQYSAFLESLGLSLFSEEDKEGIASEYDDMIEMILDDSYEADVIDDDNEEDE